MKKVYWAPYFEDDRTDWNILYEDPILLSFNSYSFTNPITTKLQIKNNELSYLSKNYIYSFLQSEVVDGVIKSNVRGSIGSDVSIKGKELPYAPMHTLTAGFSRA